jgi:hypothetical protein
LKRNIGNLSAIQEKSGYLLRQRGNERFVGYSEVIVGSDLPGSTLSTPDKSAYRKLAHYLPGGGQAPCPTRRVLL